MEPEDDHLSLKIVRVLRQLREEHVARVQEVAQIHFQQINEKIQ